MYSALRKLLFVLEAERSHDVALGTMAGLSRCRYLRAALRRGNPVPAFPVDVMGIRFPNPVGLAAGLDKRASAANALHALGFGWLELGTVTPRPQSGNPKPRLFRLGEHQALVNRMGFNSPGLDVFLGNLRRARPEIIKGINIGKNAATDMAHAIDDYLYCLERVHEHADYVCINISSPNTRNLRDLQHEEALDALLGQLDRRRNDLDQAAGRAVPLVLKVAPDLDDDGLDAVARLSRRHRMNGIAATNTTLSRAGVESHPHADEAGGLSGRPLRERATEVIQALHRNLQGEIPLIGIGGIDSAESAMEKLQAGADLVQVYTGLIYRGPALLNEIVTGLATRFEPGEPWSDCLDTLRKANGPAAL